MNTMSEIEENIKAIYEQNNAIINEILREKMKENAELISAEKLLKRKLSGLEYEQNWDIKDEYRHVSKVFNDDDPEFREEQYSFDEESYNKDLDFFMNWAGEKAVLLKKITKLKAKSFVLFKKHKISKMRELVEQLDAKYARIAPNFEKQDYKESRTQKEIDAVKKNIKAIKKEIDAIECKIDDSIINAYKEKMKSDSSLIYGFGQDFGYSELDHPGFLFESIKLTKILDKMLIEKSSEEDKTVVEGILTQNDVKAEV